MGLEKMGPAGLLGALYDNGAYARLFETEDGAALAAHGLVSGQGVYAVCQTGAAVGAAEIGLGRRVLRLAGETGNPVITFYNSPGTKLEDGLKNMAATRRLCGAAARLSGVVPQIAVITGVCGASAALAAATADLCIMTREAELFLTPPFLSAAAGEKLPGAGKLESAIKAGVVSLAAENAADAVAKAARLVTLLPQNNLGETAVFEYTAPTGAFPLKGLTGMAAIKALCDVGSEVELFGGFGDGIITALCTVNGGVTGIASANGPDTSLGRLCAARATRFVRLCDAYSIPLVTVLNTGGFLVSSESDESGMIREAARLCATYGDATCAKVAVLAGRTFGPVFTALGDADLTVAVQGSVTAPVAPTAAVSVIYKSEIEKAAQPIETATAALAGLYETEQASAEALYKAGLANFTPAVGEVRGAVAAALEILAAKRLQRLPKKHGSMAL